MSGFDKFAWIDAIRDDDDKRFSAGVKYVLQNIALVYVRHNGAGDVYARQETIAAKLKVSLSEVKKAYKVAKQRGYFVLAEARQRGRGHHSPDRYRLQVPDEVGANCVPIRKGLIGARIDENRCTDRQKKVHGSCEIGARIVETRASDQAEQAPQGIKKGIKQGGEGGTAEADAAPTPSTPRINNEDKVIDAEVVEEDADPEPSRFCAEHAANPGRPCNTCRYLGDEHDAWKHRQSRRALTDLLREAADAHTGERSVDSLRDCLKCDEKGWLLGPDGTVAEPATKCRHERQEGAA